MMRAVLLGLALPLALSGAAAAAPFGSVDTDAARRGFEVYTQSCAACHSLNYMHFRDLAGIGFTPAQIAATAAKTNVQTGIDDKGKPVTRPATPADPFPAPFASEDAARAAMNGALPPDLTLMAKARDGGADYIEALLTGYKDPPKDLKLGPGMNYNPVFPGGQIAMPPPLSAGAITYSDQRVASTVDQNAADVAAFLAWTADPQAANRRRVGWIAVGYFVLMTGVTFKLRNRIFAGLK
jgi:ubiquinol-cytochrome c reductase cytochrome c1 subunit